MEEKIFENKIVSEIKKLIISDSSLSYGERKTLEKFIIKINQGEPFDDSVGVLLRGLQKIDKSDSIELSSNVKVLFDSLKDKYEIPVAKTGIGVALHPRISNAQWFWMMLFFIVFVFLMFTGKLNFILDFINKYLD